MPDEDPTDERQDDVESDEDDVEVDEDDVEVDEDEVEEATIDVDEDVTVEERLEVDEDEVEEEVAVEADGEETTAIEEDVPVEVEDDRTPLAGTRERIEEEADRAVEGFDERVVDMLSWALDTETRARIYVHLRQQPYSTSEEVAEGTGLYPSTVREALAELHEEDRVERRKRESEGAGNNPYEYTAIAPSDLVGSIVGQVQDELNTLFNLDRRLGPDAEGQSGTDVEPVSISVEEESDGSEASGGEGDAEEGEESGDSDGA